MSKGMIGCIWKVAWGNPYKDPPEGMGQVLAESFQPVGSEYWSKHPPEIDAAYPGFGKGYCVCWSAICEPPKAMSKEKLSSIRKKRLERRMRAKYPLFADQLIAEEIAKKPDYYDGITDPEIELKRNEFIQIGKDKVENWRVK